MTKRLTANGLRKAFLDYFIEREHSLIPASGLIPTHPMAPLFTNAGMVQFIPVFLGEESPPVPLATSAQKCLRVRGKHDDIDIIGRTTRHLTFFEMLGNFSFGQYFKAAAIEFAWDFLTETLGLDGDRMWATVHESDDEAEGLWREIVDMPAERIQRLGEDNFWEMAATGPCGPSSEIFYDKGAEFGAGGGPLHGGEERFVEIWNLVFMQYNRLADGTLSPLPKRNIDTGAGMERLLPIIQGTNSVFDTDVLRSLIGTAEELTGHSYGKDEELDVSLRIVADHARAVTFLISDGVVPSNEERGYVLRRIVRRAVRHAQRAGARRSVMPDLATAVAAVMREGYPEVEAQIDDIRETLEREEHRFLDTLSVGLGMLEDQLALGDIIPGDVAFRLHDTFGFPFDLTGEIAGERGMAVDKAGFEAAMTRQREQARAAGDRAPAVDAAELRTLREQLGADDFTGYTQTDGEATVRAVRPAKGEDPRLVEVYVDRTPFYATSGGQIGDTGRITSAGAVGEIVATDAPVPKLTRHLVQLSTGELAEGDAVSLEVDTARRNALRRAHTATHLVHWSLRETLGDQLHQQGSLVQPDELRLDFNYHSAVSDEQLRAVEDLVVDQILGNGEVRTEEMALADARTTGALMFFGEKYGDRVRVVQAGSESTELCGGTHVGALGEIGGFFIRSESSVGSNLRRIEAVVGRRAHDAARDERALIRTATKALRVPPDQLLEAVDRIESTAKEADQQIDRLLSQLDEHVAAELVRGAEDGVIVARVDGRDQPALRVLALRLLDKPDVRAVGLYGTADGSSAGVVAAVSGGGDARQAVRAAARAVGGGGGGNDPRVAVGGGPRVSDLELAGKALRTMLREPAT